MEELNIEQPISKKSRKKVSKKKLDDLLNDDNYISETPIVESNYVAIEDNCFYKKKLRV